MPAIAKGHGEIRKQDILRIKKKYFGPKEKRQYTVRQVKEDYRRVANYVQRSPKSTVGIILERIRQDFPEVAKLIDDEDLENAVREVVIAQNIAETQDIPPIAFGVAARDLDRLRALEEMENAAVVTGSSAGVGQEAAVDAGVVTGIDGC